MNLFNRMYREAAGGDGEGGDGGGGGGGEPSWRDSLSDEYKGSEALKDYTDLNGMAKSHIELQKMIGNSIRIPSEDASDEARQAFHQKIIDKVPALAPMPNEDDAEATSAFWQKVGVPAESKDYALPEAVDAEAFAGLSDIAMVAGLTKAQFAKLASGLSEEGISSQAAAREALEGEHSELHREWGSAKDDKLTAINNMLKNSDAPDTLVNAVKEGNVGADFMRWADGMIKALGSEGKELMGQPKGTSDHLTPDEAHLKINDIMNNREHPYWGPNGPAKDAAMKKMMNLHKMAGGQKVA